MADKKPFAAKFIAEPGRKFLLSKHDPRDDSAFDDKDKAKEQLVKDAEAIDALQDRMFAEGKQALLVILQGIDCSGKDGTVRAVFNTCGPLGVVVKSYGVPSDVERAHANRCLTTSSLVSSMVAIPRILLNNLEACLSPDFI